jgi:NADH dehydrogenase
MSGENDIKVAVTGASGFLGRQVVRSLVERKYKVRAIVHRKQTPEMLDAPGVEVFVGDVQDLEIMRQAVKGCDWLIHLAAILRERGGITYRMVNELGTGMVFAAAKTAKISRAVNVSAIGAAPDSPTPYLTSRWIGERVAQKSGVATATVRFSALFGEGDEFINALAALVRLSPVVPIAGSGKNRFQPLAVDDAAEAVVSAIEGGVRPGSIVDLGGPEILTYNEIVDTVAAELNRKILKVHAPLGALYPLAALAQRIIKTPPVTTAQLKMLRGDSVPSGSHFEAITDYAPRPLAGNINYIQKLTLSDAIRIAVGKMPRHIRDH